MTQNLIPGRDDRSLSLVPPASLRRDINEGRHALERIALWSLDRDTVDPRRELEILSLTSKGPASDSRRLAEPVAPRDDEDAGEPWHDESAWSRDPEPSLP